MLDNCQLQLVEDNTGKMWCNIIIAWLVVIVAKDRRDMQPRGFPYYYQNYHDHFHAMALGELFWNPVGVPPIHRQTLATAHCEHLNRSTMASTVMMVVNAS